MKTQKFWPRILTGVLLIALLTGCAARSPMGEAAPDYADKEPMATIGGNASADTGVITDRKLIRKVSMSAETENLDELLKNLSQRIRDLSGYVESRNIHNGSPNASTRHRSAELVIRIPADQLDLFITHVEGVSNIVSTQETSDDITLQYVATESRLKVLRAEEERLLAFMEQAKTIPELLEIEARLTQVRSELETITSQLNVYDNLVSYGTVRLSVTEVREYTVVEEEPTLWDRIATGFTGSIRNLGVILSGLLVFAISALPYLVIPGILLILILVLSRRKKKKHTPKQT